LPPACGGSIVQYEFGMSESFATLYTWELLDSGDRFVSNDTILSGNTFSTNDTMVNILWGHTSGNHSFIVTQTNLHKIGSNCTSVPESAYVNIDYPQVTIPPVVNLCADTFYVYSVPDGFKKYLWMDPNHDSTKSQSITVTQPGIYWVEVLDGMRCKRRDSSDLQVHQLPIVNIGHDTILCNGSPITLDAGNPGSTYLWSQWMMNDSATIHETTQQLVVAEGGKVISVKVTDQFGCSASDTVKIFGCNSNMILGFVPNTFTPNGDGDHDTWYIANLELLPFINDITRVEVYDRWGLMVYQSAKGHANNWDGTNNNHQPLLMDSYYYIFFIDGQKPVYGNITIIR